MNEILPSDILIVVFHTRQNPWEEIVQQGQFRTWVPKSVEDGYSVSYCFGPNPNLLSKKIDKWNESLRWDNGALVSTLRNYINKTVATPFKGYIPRMIFSRYPGAPKGVTCINLKIWDLYSMGRWKTLAIFKHFIEKKEHKFLVILTSSAFLQPDLLRKRLIEITEDIIYAGPLIQKESANPFVSGAQIVVNRKFAEGVLSNLSYFPAEKLNDLGLAAAAKNMGVTPIELPTVNFRSIEEIQNASDELIKSNYHFRLKSFKAGMRNDVELFLKLKEKIEDIEKN